MNKVILFNIWAPVSSRWSNWVKPVLFAHWSGIEPLEHLANPPDLSHAPPADGRTALVIDLPGVIGVAAGIELARRGYRPVPLYNACPPPPRITGSVDVQAILLSLAEGAVPLSRIALPPQAPPAFLLDADRRWGDSPPMAGQFDNRSVSFPTDFPSAAFLRGASINRILLIQNREDRPQEDLAHTLRLWQEGGLTLELLNLELPQSIRAITIRRPSIFGWIAFRAGLLLKLKRNPLGGYGGYLSPPSAG